MKRIDYYASQNRWQMPKWLGATLGGIFGTIAIGSGIMIYSLTRPPVLAAAVAVGSVAQPAAVVTPPPAVAPSAPVAEAAPEAESATESPQPADSKHHSAKHHASAHGKKAASAKLASAKKAPAAGGMSADKRATILAKHDTKAKKGDKDALDKLLGL